ncbi:MAG: cyclase family protein [Pseudomonadota bacterium]
MDPKTISGLVKTGKVYDLGMDYYVGMPHHPNHPPFAFSLTKVHGDMVYAEGVSAANCLFTTGGHTGTHMDAHAHIAVNNQVYGVGDITPWQGYQGMVKGGIDQVAPVVCRGVLLDIAGLHGLDCLANDHGVGAADIAAACRREGVEIHQGDAVLIRTGWIRYFADARQYIAHHGGCPGLVPDGAELLAAKGVAHVGGDTVALERTPSPALSVHQVLLVNNGIHIIEAMHLDELARDQTYEFLFMVSPLKIRGGTASPVRPVAVA